MTTLHCYCQPKIDSIKSLWATFLIRIYLIIVIKKTLYSCCNCCCENCIVIVIVRTTLLLSSQDRLTQIHVANIFEKNIPYYCCYENFVLLLLLLLWTLYFFCYCEDYIVIVIPRWTHSNPCCQQCCGDFILIFRRLHIVIVNGYKLQGCCNSFNDSGNQSSSGYEIGMAMQVR